MLQGGEEGIVEINRIIAPRQTPDDCIYVGSIMIFEFETRLSTSDSFYVKTIISRGSNGSHQDLDRTFMVNVV